jgi:hypothetical protein
MHEKRKAATVVINMCKLVLNPSDVEPFVTRCVCLTLHLHPAVAPQTLISASMPLRRGAYTPIYLPCRAIHPWQYFTHLWHVHFRLLPELRKSAEDAAFEEIRGVCATAEQVLLRAMGEAGIAEINEKDRKAREAATHENGTLEP